MTLTPGFTNYGAFTTIGGQSVPVVAVVDASGNVVGEGGGVATVQITGAKTGVTVVKASAGQLCRVLLQAANATNTILIYDNATAASGTVIGAIPATAVAGMYAFDMPAVNGITVAGNATNPAMTVSFY